MVKINFDWICSNCIARFKVEKEYIWEEKCWFECPKCGMKHRLTHEIIVYPNTAEWLDEEGVLREYPNVNIQEIVHHLRELNGITDPGKLQPGQVLELPVFEEVMFESAEER